mgnify:FL=1
MSNIYINLTGDTATILNVVPTNMRLCNVHATDSVGVDLYLYKTEIDKEGERTYVGQGGNWNALVPVEETYYILKNLEIPFGVTLLLNEEVLNYNHEKYDLYIKLSASDSAVDISISILMLNQGVNNTGSNNTY